MKQLLLCFLLSVLSYQLSAQTTYEIRGIVADSVSQKPLDYATVALNTDANQPVKTILTKEDGSFSFTGIQQGRYLLNIVSMGYQRKGINIELNTTRDLGIISIAPQTTALNAVTVTADRPLVKMDIDKISYDLQADPESKVTSVLDMIRKVPLLSLDHEDNIQLKGSRSYRILINGRPSAMMERNPKDILRSMAASTIQSIEVITNPPAKYDGEGLAGIINIVTVKKIENGYNGSLNWNQRFPAGGPGLGSSFNFKQGKWGISTNLGGNLFFDPTNIAFNTQTVNGAKASELRQDIEREYKSRNAYGNTQLSYEIDSLNLISGQFGYSKGAFDQLVSTNSVLRYQNGSISAYQLGNDNSGKRHSIDGSLNYQLGFKSNKQRLLTFSYRYLSYYDERIGEAWLRDKINYALPDYMQNNEGGSEEQTFQVDFVHPSKKLMMESGIKGILRNNFSDFQYLSKSLSGKYVITPALSNQFDNTQNVFSFYNSWQLKLTDWTFKIGVRFEDTQIKANFVSSGTVIQQDYLNVLPSISINTNFKDKSSLSFGYAQRIQRPSIWDLNPFVDRSNPTLERSGNSDLRPVVANNFQLTYNRPAKTSFSAVLSHSFSNNALQYYLLFDPVNNTNRLMPANTGSNKTTGININLVHPITPKWNANFTANLNYVVVRGYVDGLFAENDGMTGNFMLSSGYRFEKGWRVNGNVNYLLTPYILLQGSGIAILFSGFSINKDFLKEKLSLSASVNNPFQKYMYFPNNIKTSNYDFVNTGRGWFRTVSYSLNYKFGKLKSQVTKNKRGINNDDIEGGARP